MPDSAQTPGTQAEISPSMTVREILAVLPSAAAIMTEYGLHCFSCSVAGTESLAEGCRIHGFDDETTAALVSDLNDALQQAPERPQMLTVTGVAAAALKQIGSEQGHTDEALLVTFDMNGNFCLEFIKEPDPSYARFTHADHPDLPFVVSPLVLRRIGGATVDLRDGRFKLDMPEADCATGGCTPETMRLQRRYNAHMIRIPASLEQKLKRLFPCAAERNKFVVDLIQSALGETGMNHEDIPESVGGTVFLFTDGGSRGNPGQAAIACVLEDAQTGSLLREHYERIGIETNNVAEYRALIEGLKIARRYHPNRLVCHLDSELIVKQLSGEYRVKMESLQGFVEEIRELTLSFPSIEFKHIPRADNHRADALVNKALDEHPAPHYEKPY